MSINQGYLESVAKLFRMYKKLGDQSMAQLEAPQLFIAPSSESNSIAVIVKHMSGNMISRWTDFLTTDGEKPWRDRDEEFTEMSETREALLLRWEEGWDCLLQTIDSLKENDLESIVYIRNEGHTVYEAINRQIAHYAYHVGQIVFAAKLLKQGEWNSLSIPKNQSAAFNAEKFAHEKRRKNFTDDEK